MERWCNLVAAELLVPLERFLLSSIAEQTRAPSWTGWLAGSRSARWSSCGACTTPARSRGEAYWHAYEQEVERLRDLPKGSGGDGRRQCDGIQEGALRDAAFAAIVEADLTDGIHRNPTNRPERFTIAYFHRPEEIGPEIERRACSLRALFAVEGPGWVNEDLDAWLDNEAERGRLLEVLRRLETEPSLIGASAHLLAVARA